MKALTEEGRSKYREWVESIAAHLASSPPVYLLDSDETSFSIPNTPPVERGQYLTKSDFAEAMYRYVKAAEDARIDHDRWPGIWDALALQHFDMICPQKPGGGVEAERQRPLCFHTQLQGPASSSSVWPGNDLSCSSR